MKACDVVLVTDRSGSMRKNNRMQAAINAGKTFVEIALKGKNKERNRIALVSYSSITDVLLDSPFSNNADTLKGIIDQYKINGSTATGTALLKAVQQMANSQAKNKIIVLLSDGEPYPPDTPPHWEDYLIYCNAKII